MVAVLCGSKIINVHYRTAAGLRSNADHDRRNHSTLLNYIVNKTVRSATLYYVICSLTIFSRITLPGEKPAFFAKYLARLEIIIMCPLEFVLRSCIIRSPVIAMHSHVSLNDSSVDTKNK